jgi:hypothetical protein
MARQHVVHADARGRAGPLSCDAIEENRSRNREVPDSFGAAPPGHHSKNSLTPRFATN